LPKSSRWLNRLFVELFNADVYGNIRRCQGFVSRCTKEINQSGHELANERIAAAIASMRRYNKFRVPHFKALLDQARKCALKPEAGRDIVRRPDNPMLRYVAGAIADDSVPETISTESRGPCSKGQPVALRRKVKVRQSC
jgi:hypothetical protein